jgi:hypothetical protein
MGLEEGKGANGEVMLVGRDASEREVEGLFGKRSKHDNRLQEIPNGAR